MKTIQQALIDEIHYPIPEGFVENVMIKRKLNPVGDCDSDTMNSKEYMGALADCLWSLVQATIFLKQTSLSVLYQIKTKNVFCYVLTQSIMPLVNLR